MHSSPQSGDAPIKGGVNKAHQFLSWSAGRDSTELHLRGRNLRKFVKLATWNVRTSLDRDEVQRMERRSAVVAKELEKIGVDTAALQETRLEGSGMAITP